MAASALLIWCLVGFFYNNVPWTSACASRKQADHANTVMCKSGACRRSSLSSYSEQIINQINKTADPCLDFYNFACGKFVQDATIPDDQSSLKSTYLMENQVQEEIKRSLEEESPPDELHAFKLVKKFYRACMNEAVIEEKGLNPLREMLKKLGNWPVLEGDNWIEKDFSWTEAIYRINDAGFAETFLLPLDVAVKRINNTDQLRLILSIPSHEAARTFKTSNAYHHFIVQVAVLLGADESRAKKELREALSFEYALYDYFALRIQKHSMAIPELTKTFPSIPWTEYFQRMLPENIPIDENEEIFMENSNYIVNFERVINQTSKRTQANYLMYQIVLYFTPFLNAEVRQMHLELRNKLLNYKVPLKLSERWVQCLDILPQHMYASLAGLYVRKHFAKETKQRAIEMTEDIKREFRILLKNTYWMDNESSMLAVDKLDVMKSQIGYPEEILDDVKLEEFHRGLIVDEHDFFHTFVNITRSKRAILLNNLRAAVNESSISFDRMRNYFGAYNIRSENKIYIPFGTIQTTLGITSDSPKYLNYAKLGFTIGHEIAHGFGDTGKYYDKNGNHQIINYWWTNATEALYWGKITTAKCIMPMEPPPCCQPECNIPEDLLYPKMFGGDSTLDKKLTDIAGLKMAYMAYQDWVKRNGVESGLPGLPYSPNQMFWLSAANSMCVAEREKPYDGTMTAYYYSKSAEFRVHHAFRNSWEFAKDFNCGMFSAMNSVFKCDLY